MTKLYHYTSFFAKETITEKGLRIDYKNDDTLTINETIDEHRPQHLPDFIDRSHCVFLYLKEAPYHDSDYNISVIVDTKYLDKSKLFVFDYELADRIWCDIIDAPYSGEYSGVPLGVSCKDYWASMVPYEEYIKRSEGEKYKREEVLYFGNIPLEAIQLENDRSSLFTKLADHLSKKFHVKVTSKHGLSIYIDNMQIYCNYKKAVNELKLIVFSIQYQIKEELIEEVKKIISFDDIKISDKKNKVWFSNVKLKA